MALVVANVVQGIGVSLANTVLMSVAGDAIPANRLGEDMGYRRLGVALATTHEPTVVLFASTTFGSEAVFLLLALLAAIALSVSPRRTFPSSFRGGTERDADLTRSSSNSVSVSGSPHLGSVVTRFGDMMDASNPEVRSRPCRSPAIAATTSTTAPGRS